MTVKKVSQSSITPKLQLPAGSILQVKSTDLSVPFTANLSTAGTTAITGLTVSITPSSTSSKIIVIVDVTYGSSGVGGVGESSGQALIVKRDSTAIGVGDAAGTRTRTSTADIPFGQAGLTILDSPNTTSAITYSVDLFSRWSFGGTQPVYVNREGTDTDTARVTRPASRITVMEVAG